MIFVLCRNRFCLQCETFGNNTWLRWRVVKIRESDRECACVRVRVRKRVSETERERMRETDPMQEFGH